LFLLLRKLKSNILVTESLTFVFVGDVFVELLFEPVLQEVVNSAFTFDILVRKVILNQPILIDHMFHLYIVNNFFLA